MSLGDVSGRLAGKVAIVTGAGQTPGETIGNGKARARLFARAGANVLCVDRDGARAADTVAGIESQGGVGRACAADISKAEDARRIVQECIDAFGRVDILVNNVGIGGNGDGPAHKLTEDAFDRILRVNLKGAWLVTRAVMPGMLKQRSGAIVNISSLASIAGGFQMAYEVSKAATKLGSSPARFYPWMAAAARGWGEPATVECSTVFQCCCGDYGHLFVCERSTGG